MLTEFFNEKISCDLTVIQPQVHKKNVFSRKLETFNIVI